MLILMSILLIDWYILFTNQALEQHYFKFNQIIKYNISVNYKVCINLNLNLNFKPCCQRKGKEFNIFVYLIMF